MIRQLSRKFFTLEQWSAGWAKVEIGKFLAAPHAADFQWIRPGSSRELIADPFGIEEDGELFILAEQLVHGASVGRIIRYGAEQPAGEILLRQPWHLSYPFVVEDAGQRFIVPEQSQSRTLAFYPYSSGELGAPAATIEGFDAVDATFLRHDGLWWLFCTHYSRGPNGPLYLYWSERLFGPYQPHPMNPIVSELSHARPGGRIIRSPDALLRPAQDCSRHYGSAIVLCRIETLTVDAYSERPVMRIEPSQLKGGFSDGVHTLDHTDHYVMVDTKRFAPSLSAPPIKIAGLAKRFRKRLQRGISPA